MSKADEIENIKQQLSQNAEEFDTIVAKMLARQDQMFKENCELTRTLDHIKYLVLIEGEWNTVSDRDIVDRIKSLLIPQPPSSF